MPASGVLEHVDRERGLDVTRCSHRERGEPDDALMWPGFLQLVLKKACGSCRTATPLPGTASKDLGALAISGEAGAPTHPLETMLGGGF